MPTSVDTRHPVAVLATKPNIVANDYAGTQYAIASADYYVEGVDAATAADSVVTIDTPVSGSTPRAVEYVAPSTGFYAVYLEATIPGAAGAGKELLVQIRDAANAATLETLGTWAQGSGKRTFRRILNLKASERIRVLSGADVGGAALVSAKLLIAKLD